MLVSRSSSLLAVTGVSILATAWAEPPTKLTPRELFYATPPLASTPKPVTQAKKSRPAKPVSTTPTQQAAKQESVPTMGSQPVQALGLRYSILKYDSSGAAEEEDVDAVFRTGDRIRLRVSVNEPGYLYVAHKGSSGSWRMLFPSEDLDGGSNAVVPGREYDLPGRTRLVFDETPGEEKIFVVVSRAPEPEMDRIIYELDQKSSPTRKDAPKTLLAEAKIPDAMVANARMAARDLVFEKVDSSKPAPSSAGGRRENAVYVVNASASKDARLVADITLKHR